MAKSKSLPSHTITIRTYEKLEQFAQAFAAGHLNFLILIGRAGVGKSQCVRRSLSNSVCWIDGTASPFGIYLSAWEYRDQLLVLDDVDGMYANQNGVRLLKCLCQSDAVKSVSWQSQAGELSKRNIPRHFQTRSRVAIIGNQWTATNADVVALMDRGHVVLFEPDAVEVHRQASTWFWDAEVFEFIGQRLHLIKDHSLRTYVLASEQKLASLNWRQFVLSRCLTGTALIVAEMKSDPQFSTEQERVRAFVEAGHGCRATWFNYARDLREVSDASHITLACSEVTECESADELSGLSFL